MAIEQEPNENQKQWYNGFKLNGFMCKNCLFPISCQYWFIHCPFIDLPTPVLTKRQIEEFDKQ